MWTKILSFEINIFGFTNDGKKWSGIYFEFHRAPSEIPANLQGQFSLSGQIFFALGSSNSEGAHGISKYFFLGHFSPSFLSKKW